MTFCDDLMQKIQQLGFMNLLQVMYNRLPSSTPHQKPVTSHFSMGGKKLTQVQIYVWLVWRNLAPKVEVGEGASDW